MLDGHRSGRSTGRVSCKSTELKRCSMIEMRWNKYYYCYYVLTILHSSYNSSTNSRQILGLILTCLYLRLAIFTPVCSEMFSIFYLSLGSVVSNYVVFYRDDAWAWWTDERTDGHRPTLQLTWYQNCTASCNRSTHSINAWKTGGFSAGMADRDVQPPSLVGSSSSLTLTRTFIVKYVHRLCRKFGC